MKLTLRPASGRLSWLFLISLGLSIPPASASQKLSWKVCVETAEKFNAELQAAKENLLASTFSERGAYSGFFPQLTGTLGYTYGNSAVSTTSGTTVTGVGTTTSNSYSTYSLNLTANQNLFNGLADYAKVESAKASLAQTQANLTTARAKLSYDLKSAFAGMLYAQESIRLQDDIIHRRQENLRMVELRFESGRENKGSLLLSRAYLSQANFEALQARNALEVARTQLMHALGREDLEGVVVAADIPLSEPPQGLRLEPIVPTTPDHLVAVAQEDSAHATLTSARSGFFPTLGLTGSYGKSGQDMNSLNEKWSVGATLNIPLFNGGRDYYATKSASASVRASALNLNGTDRQVLTKLSQAYDGFVEAVEKLKVDRSFREAQFARAEIARSKYGNGLISFDDWDIIENDLILREKTLIASERDRIVAEAAWEQAQGKGAIP